ncbi:hypothetical protein HUJ04_008073 [Dendroctonus ponderosae]|nr:hypothetical protein HUJ04_008073 [Dendroctonus ponderosae]KAH1026336.1 hypothetical protein HUJ05_010871 [Dendroctonus ponderosae]
MKAAFSIEAIAFAAVIKRFWSQKIQMSLIYMNNELSRIDSGKFTERTHTIALHMSGVSVQAKFILAQTIQAANFAAVVKIGNVASHFLKFGG